MLMVALSLSKPLPNWFVPSSAQRAWPMQCSLSSGPAVSLMLVTHSDGQTIGTYIMPFGQRDRGKLARNRR